MDTELAKKRIASYLQGHISWEELHAFLDSFGDALTEEVYAEFLLEQFEEYVAADPHSETSPENLETPRIAEKKKQKSSQPGQALFVCVLPFWKATASRLFSALQGFENYRLSICPLCSFAHAKSLTR